MNEKKENEVKEEKSLTPQQYFDQVKERKHHCTDEMLQKVYDNCLTLLNKYKITNQKVGMRKLLFHLDCIEKEREVIKLGVDTFVYKDDIEDYIDHVADDAVKVIELERYEREIPDEIVEVVEKVKDKFDKLYVIFTDYTGKVERQVKKEKRAKDPILFGAFINENARIVVDRFYYLGDWVDEYCDLTLDKMVNEIRKKKDKDIRHTINTPEDLEELKKQLNGLEINPIWANVGNTVTTSEFKVVDDKKKKLSLFSRIKPIFKKSE